MTTRPRSLALPALCWGLIAQAAVPLPAQPPDRHLGVASCASSVCHGAVQSPARPGALMNEFVTWSHEDSHAKAYQALVSPLARSIAAKLRLGPAETEKLCLDCHTDNVPQSQRGDKFALTDGIGCEACHGGAERWISSHASNSNYRSDIKSGMYPTADLRERSRLCLSCHYGDKDKFATHRIMAAGHPRLSFELDTFLALEPVHYRIDDQYRERKTAYSKTQSWSRGQLLTAHAQMLILEGPMRHTSRTFPELALFNCTSCHDTSMHRLEWRNRRLTEGIDPGSVLLNDANLRMAWVIARTLSAREGDIIKGLIQALQKDAVEDWPHIGVSAAQLRSALADVLTRMETAGTAPSARNLLDNVLQAGIDGEYRDYLGAEQAVMAIDLLMMDANLAQKYRAQRDELFRLVHSDETFRSTEFIASLKSLGEAIK
ncbi:MAG: cytochrome c family protein [Pseudomonadota bacterium]|nr:cytochrome c family protein [Pseudomonadota bacterium]